MATPSLALIPTGYKAGKVYSVLPESGVGDFDFTRASTATRTNSSGLLESVATGVPRLEYPLDGGCPSLLLEPQATNLITYPVSFDNAYWTKSGATIDDNAGAGFSAPSVDFPTSAFKLVTTNASAFLSFNSSFAGNNTITTSFFAKSGTTSSFTIQEVFYTSTIASFDLSNGTSVGGTIKELSNGWYKCSVTFLYTAGQTLITAQIKTPSAGSIYLFMAQVETGRYATSPTLTSLTAEGTTTTRVAEACNGAGDAATFNDSEGVLMTEISALDENAETERYVYIGNGTTSNRVVIRYSTTQNDIRMLVTSGGSTQVSSGTTNYNITENHKIALKYKANDFALWIDGVEVLTDTNGSTPTGINQLTLSYSGTQFYGNTKQIQYYNTALTDAELIALTS